MVEVSEIGNHPLVKGLLASLDGEVKNHVLATINALDKILATIDRWKGGEINDIDNTETNKDHVLGMLDLVLANLELFSKICNIEDLIIAILIHDMGEFYIGDISQSRRGYDDLKRRTKKYEKLIASILIGKVENEVLRKKASKIMDRCFNFKLGLDILKTDITILVLKILDMVQAFSYGLEKVFPTNLKNYPNKKEQISEHMISRLVLIEVLFSELTKIISSTNPETLKEVTKLFDSITDDFRNKIGELTGDKVIITPDMYDDGIKYLIGKYK